MAVQRQRRYAGFLTRVDALARLRASEPELRALGASAMWLFGSTARDEARIDSDVDLLIDVDEDRFPTFDLLRLATLKHAIERRTAGRVDILVREDLSPALRQSALPDAVPVF